ncbi:hypothetical protein H2200_011822 [Cladophialophora chaetospira]|uniref:Cytochrome P450 n=1 Tax=Cladophialophora chaetospira TaxID=386627 RepID=A0AA39CCW4_9EURO|nr:hypothetical protein H2200_011822 [Cladophialophora chaetospira]
MAALGSFEDVNGRTQLFYATAGISLCLIILHYLFNLFRTGLRSIPGPFLAHLTSLYRIRLVWRGGAVKNYRALHKKYGPIVRTGSHHISISDPTEIPLVYGVASKFRKSQFYQLSTPYYEGKVSQSQLLFGFRKGRNQKVDSMFTVIDPVEHRDLRAPTAQVYSMTNIRNYEQHIDECTDIFFDILKDLDGREDQDFTHFFNFYTFDVITAITYQKRMGFLKARSDVYRMLEGIDVQALYFAYVGQFPHLHKFLYGNRAFIKFVQWLAPNMPDPLADLHRQVAIEIDRYDTEGRQPDRKDFLAQLRAKDDPYREHFRRDMTNHLSNNIIAGSDTTSIAIRAIFYHLTKSPKVYIQLQAELDDADARRQFSKFVTYDESLKLPYLQAVIREAMRVHPSNCYPLERIVPPGGAEILGHHIPGGVNVAMMAPILNRAESIYGQDAEQFRPERWLEASPEALKAMDRSYFTFGHGSRGCIGKNIALLEIAKFVPQVLRYWKVEWTLGDEPWETHSMWFYKQTVHFKFTARPGKAWKSLDGE